MINTLIEPMGKAEIGQRRYSVVDKNEKPKDIECLFCNKKLEHTIIGEGAFRCYSAPGHCDCEKATEYWEIYNKKMEEIERECEELENRERRKYQVNELVYTSNLGRRFKERTFETFKTNNTNREIFNKTLNYAQNFIDLEKKGKGLFITGAVGTGKTHLSVAIANYLMYEEIIPVKFGNVTNLLSEVKSSYDKQAIESESEIIEALSRVRLLIIDDLGKEKATEWSNNIIYTIINNRYEDYKPLIVTTNLSVKELENTIGEATVSRLIEMCDGVKINGVDYRKNKLK